MQAAITLGQPSPVLGSKASSMMSQLNALAFLTHKVEQAAVTENQQR